MMTKFNSHSEDDVGEVLEESVVVLGVLLNPRLELLVLNKSNVAGKHHERLGGLVLVLSRAVPLLPLPLLFNEEAEVVVGQDSGGESPRATVAGTVGVTSAQSVGTREGNDFLIVETHTAEDTAEMILALGSVRKTAIGCAARDIAVGTARSVRDSGTQHLLDSTNAGKDPEIRVGDPRELLLDRLKEVTGSGQTGVGTVVRLRSESHGSSIAATGTSLLVVGATGVPGKTN
ncbi:hypothetical protein HG531_013416 [Fusarium graminearum]|nr:hypothetical protein HG531_013416 [Fusarium graminearum]